MRACFLYCCHRSVVWCVKGCCASCLLYVLSMLLVAFYQLCLNRAWLLWQRMLLSECIDMFALGSFARCLRGCVSCRRSLTDMKCPSPHPPIQLTHPSPCPTFSLTTAMNAVPSWPARQDMSTSLHLKPNQASQESPWILPVGLLRLQISNRVPARSEVESALLARRQLFRGAGKQQQQQQQQQQLFQLSLYFGVEDSIKESVRVSQTSVCIAFAPPNISIGSTCVFYIPCVCWHLLVFQSLSFVLPSTPLGRPSRVGLIFSSTNDWRRKKGIC